MTYTQQIKDTVVVITHDNVNYKNEAFSALVLLAIFIIVYAMKKPVENVQKTINVSHPVPPLAHDDTKEKDKGEE